MHSLFNGTRPECDLQGCTVPTMTKLMACMVFCVTSISRRNNVITQLYNVKEFEVKENCIFLKSNSFIKQRVTCLIRAWIIQTCVNMKLIFNRLTTPETKRYNAYLHIFSLKEDNLPDKIPIDLTLIFHRTECKQLVNVVSFNYRYDYLVDVQGFDENMLVKSIHKRIYVTDSPH